MRDRVTTDDASALERFERVTAWPMLILSVAILPLLIIPFTMRLSESTEATLLTIDWLIWGLFALEYGIRLYLAPRKREFLRHNVIDLVVVAVPLLRPLRVARSVRLLRALRAARAAVFVARGLKAARVVLTRHKLHYALVVTLLVVVGSALLVAAVEGGAPGSSIGSIGDALWWAITTVTTVGYGDLAPVTPVGRGVAVVLMILGIGLFGLLAASLASFFISEEEEEEEAETQARLDDIARRLQRIEESLERGPGRRRGA